MKKEQIEQAATDACIMERNIYNDEYQPYYMDGFKDGAKWRISSVWHDISEIPEYGRMLLCVSMSYQPLICGPDNGDFMDTARYFDITSWAYIDDLIPEKEGR
jgi:hypothetical protein|nr:MAG TPA: hypothetical protein [Caudoviricetes sp.]